MKDLSQENIQRINAKVAELCGWTNIVHRHSHSYGTSPKGEPFCIVPNYWQSLDACAEMEESLRKNQFHYVNYPRELFKLVTGRAWDGDFGYFLFDFTFATAPQRVTAFLSVHNLTIEEI